MLSKFENCKIHRSKEYSGQCSVWKSNGEIISNHYDRQKEEIFNIKYKIWKTLEDFMKIDSNAQMEEYCIKIFL